VVADAPGAVHFCLVFLNIATFWAASSSSVFFCLVFLNIAKIATFFLSPLHATDIENSTPVTGGSFLGCV
jgi:hypothetical protein